MANMLAFLYFRNYGRNEYGAVGSALDFTKRQDPAAPLINHVKTYILAEKYDIDHLKCLTEVLYFNSVETGWIHPSFPESLRLIY